MRSHLKKLKIELGTKDELSKDYSHQEGKFIVNIMLYFKSHRFYFQTEQDWNRRTGAQITQQSLFWIVAYNALRCQVEIEYDCFINNTPYNEILSKFNERTH